MSLLHLLRHRVRFNKQLRSKYINSLSSFATDSKSSPPDVPSTQLPLTKEDDNDKPVTYLDNVLIPVEKVVKNKLIPFIKRNNLHKPYITIPVGSLFSLFFFYNDIIQIEEELYEIIMILGIFGYIHGKFGKSIAQYYENSRKRREDHYRNLENQLISELKNTIKSYENVIGYPEELKKFYQYEHDLCIKKSVVETGRLRYQFQNIVNGIMGSFLRMEKLHFSELHSKMVSYSYAKVLEDLNKNNKEIKDQSFRNALDLLSQINIFDESDKSTSTQPDTKQQKEDFLASLFIKYINEYANDKTKLKNEMDDKIKTEIKKSQDIIDDFFSKNNIASKFLLDYDGNNFKVSKHNA